MRNYRPAFFEGTTNVCTNKGVQGSCSKRHTRQCYGKKQQAQNVTEYSPITAALASSTINWLGFYSCIRAVVHRGNQET